MSRCVELVRPLVVGVSIGSRWNPLWGPHVILRHAGKRAAALRVFLPTLPKTVAQACNHMRVEASLGSRQPREKDIRQKIFIKIPFFNQQGF